MHLDSSYHSVRTTILAQKTEPSLDDIKSILTSSAAADIVEVKVEHQEIALRMQVCTQKTKGGSGVIDEKGYHWCDPTNNRACHRCGQPGHIAAHCMYVMPQHVKDWVTLSRSCSTSPLLLKLMQMFHRRNMLVTFMLHLSILIPMPIPTSALFLFRICQIRWEILSMLIRWEC